MPWRRGPKIDRIVRVFKKNNDYWETWIANVYPVSWDAYPYFYLQRINTSASIAILLLTTQDEFVLLTQYRVPVDKNVLEPVAWLMEWWATITETIVHECAQEAWYKATRLIPTGKIAPSAWATSEVIYTFLWLDATYVGKKATNEIIESTIKTQVLSFEEMKREMLHRQEAWELIDPKIGHILNQALFLGVPEIITLYKNNLYGIIYEDKNMNEVEFISS